MLSDLSSVPMSSSVASPIAQAASKAEEATAKQDEKAAAAAAESSGSRGSGSNVQPTTAPSELAPSLAVTQSSAKSPASRMDADPVVTQDNSRIQDGLFEDKRRALADSAAGAALFDDVLQAMAAKVDNTPVGGTIETAEPKEISKKADAEPAFEQAVETMRSLNDPTGGVGESRLI